MPEQLDLWHRLGWRDCANAACATEWGPMPPAEFRADPNRQLCSVCMVEAGISETKMQDRMRYSPTRKAQVDRANARRAKRLSESDKRALREKRQDYDRRRYLARKQVDTKSLLRYFA